MQHTLAVIVLSFILFLFIAGTLSPLWIRKEQARVFYARIFTWFTLGSGVVLVSIIIWAGLSNYLSGRAESRTLVTLAVFTIIVICSVSYLLYELPFKRHMERLETEKLIQLYPDSPWKWSKRWGSNRIEYSDKGEIIFSYLLTAIIITGIVLSFFLNAEGIVKRFHENRLDSLIILYILVMGTLFAVRFAVHSTNRWRKFKRSSFVMSTFPGVIGGKLEGEIQTRSKRVPCDGFDLKLSCIEMDITFRQSFHNITETVLWESEKKVRIDNIRMGPCGISFPVSFNIPVTTEETDTLSRERRVYWLLTAHCSGEDHGFSAAFKVPVFRVTKHHTISAASDPL
ncbi:MAG: hypothetical protein H6Q94_962 [Nitrospirae bacterium]|nr:hypothetical protein [Nitrospirota bacterium]